MKSGFQGPCSASQLELVLLSLKAACHIWSCSPLIGSVQLNVPQPQDSFSERKSLSCTARGPAGQ